MTLDVRLMRVDEREFDLIVIGSSKKKPITSVFERNKAQKQPKVEQQGKERCKDVVAKLIGGPDSAFMFGGAVREVDAFNALAAVAPDEWASVGTPESRAQALNPSGKGLELQHPLRVWQRKLLEACATDDCPVSVAFERCTIRLNDKHDYVCSNIFRGVQLRHALRGDEITHMKRTRWTTLQGALAQEGFIRAQPIPPCALAYLYITFTVQLCVAGYQLVVVGPEKKKMITSVFEHLFSKPPPPKTKQQDKPATEPGSRNTPEAIPTAGRASSSAAMSSAVLGKRKACSTSAVVPFTGVPDSPPPDKHQRIRTMLGIDVRSVPQVLKNAKEHMGMTLTGTLGEQQDAILQQLEALKVKVQSIVDKLFMQDDVSDAAINMPAILAQLLDTCKEAELMVSAESTEGTLHERADAILAQL